MQRAHLQQQRYHYVDVITYEEDEEPDGFPETALHVASGVPGAGEELLSVSYLATVVDAQIQDAQIRAGFAQRGERRTDETHRFPL